MNSKELANSLSVSDRYIRTLTKKALEGGSNAFEVKGIKVVCDVIKSNAGRGGVSYEYSLASEAKRAKKRKSVYSSIDIKELPDVDFTNVSFEDKLALVRFIIKRDSSIRAIAKVYALNSELSESALYKRIYRWVEAYKAKGKSGLIDKRGGNRVSKINEELFVASLVKRGGVWTYYSRYAYLEAKRDGKEFNVLDPAKSCSVSYSGFVKHYNKMKREPHIKAILGGVDSVNELVPMMKVDVNYPNEYWEIDATPVDVFVKVPVIDGEINYFRRVESEEYVLKRYSLVGVVDRFSKGRVCSLFVSDNSYADVRLLEKAIDKLGVPEFIRGDNGKNYVSSHFQEVLEDIGIVYDAATPYAGSEKAFIERMWRGLQHNYLFESLPGFIGHNTEERKGIENQASGKSLKGKSGSGTQTHIKEKFMWWWEAERVIDGLIEHLYSDGLEMHSRLLGSNKKEIKNLHKMLGKRFSRKVGRSGVYIRGEYYFSAELWKHFAIGDSVDVYEEIDDVNIAYVKLDNGDFIEIRNRSIYKVSIEEAKAIKKAYKDKHIKRIKDGLSLGKGGQKEMAEEIVAELKSMSSLDEKEVEEVLKKESKVSSDKDSSDLLLEIMNASGY